MAKSKDKPLSTDELFEALPHVHELWINESTGEHHLRETRGCKLVTHEARKDEYENKRKDGASKKNAYLQDNKIGNIEFA